LFDYVLDAEKRFTIVARVVFKAGRRVSRYAIAPLERLIGLVESGDVELTKRSQKKFWDFVEKEERNGR